MTLCCCRPVCLQSYELEDELDKVRAEKQQLAKKVDELQKEVGG